MLKALFVLLMMAQEPTLDDLVLCTNTGGVLTGFETFVNSGVFSFSEGDCTCPGKDVMTLGVGCEAPPPPPPPPPNGAYGLVVQALLAKTGGQWAKLAGSELDPNAIQSDGKKLLATDEAEWPFCLEAKCFRDPFMNWMSAAFDEAGARYFAPGGGGHRDRGWSEMYTLLLATMTWSRLDAPQPLDGVGTCPLPISGPPGMHQHDGVQWIPSRGEVLYTGVAPFCLGGTLWGTRTWTWDQSTWTERLDFNQTGSMAAGTANVYDPALDRVYNVAKNYFFRFDVDAGYALIDSAYQQQQTSLGTIDMDHANRWVYWTSTSVPYIRRRHIPINVSSPLGPVEVMPLPAGVVPANAMRVNPVSGNLLFFDGENDVFRYNVAEGTYELVTTPGSVGPPPSGADNEIDGAWRCLATPMEDNEGNNAAPFGACIGYSNPQDGVFVFEVPAP